ncbi:hypothetical protein BU15DRAFT_46272 [Melanogaster broomeanus]|nr:hypothetical protein BU15DRAFT_46272 [Melanogaster broomeanus]
MLNGAPILAPGGGAEVLPAGLLDSPNSLASSWFANNGFAPALISKQNSSYPAASDTSNHNAYNAFPACDSQYSPTNFSSLLTAHVNLQQQPVPDPPPPVPYTSDLGDFPRAITPPFPLPSSNSAQHVFSNVLAANPITPLPISTPSTLGLPVYSTSGLDVVAILSRVINRSNPTIHLGPVDFSCSFTIADVRRHDCPIVYASPMFYRLTGYSEHEVLGRNCRFLQSPTGYVSRGEPRRFASPEAISYMHKSLCSSKECQTSLVNYRKGGQAFINLVTVIPLRGGVHNTPEEVDEVVYHVGFQVNLTEQPNHILEKLRDGSNCVNYSMRGISGDLVLTGLGQGKHGHMMSVAVSKELRNLIADTTFTDSVPISTGTNVSGTTGTAGAGSMPIPISPSLSLLLLELLPDFLLVLSLKGSFLYVAPSVRLVLGYEPHELVGRGISDICHPADLVPLMRELKEGSTTTQTPSPSPPPSPPSPPADHYPGGLPGAPSLTGPSLCPTPPPPYVWLECRGRLHVEPGKGRKAIILSGRARWMPVVRWSSIGKAGNVGSSIHDTPSSCSAGYGSGSTDSREFWALLSSQGTLLVVSANVRDVLGWGVGEVIGRSIWGMSGESGSGVRELVDAELAKLDTSADPPPTIVTSSLVHKDTRLIPVRLIFYRTPCMDAGSLGPPSAPVQMQMNADVSSSFMHPSNTSLFEELDTGRGSSWQYELQQLKFANQRLHEELYALEGANTNTSPGAGTATTTTGVNGGNDNMSGGSGGLKSTSLSLSQFSSSSLHPSSSSALPQGSGSHTHMQPRQPQQPQTQPHCTPLIHPNTFSSSSHEPNSLHSQDPPSSDWSSLAGANGHGPNPLKRTWHSEGGPMT